MKKRIKGEQLFVFAGDDYTPLGASTDCALHVECSTIEVCAKVSRQRRTRNGLYRWAISCSRFSSFSTPFDKVGQPIKIVFSLNKGDIGELGIDTTLLSPNSKASIRGEAIVVEVVNEGSVGALAAYRLSVQGDGHLTAWIDDGYGFPYAFPIIFS